MKRRREEEESELPSTSKKAKSYRSSRLSALHDNNANAKSDDFDRQQYFCRVCYKKVPRSLTTEMRTWWERLVALAGRYYQGKMTIEIARKAYADSEKYYARPMRGTCPKYCFHMCLSHIAVIGKKWTDVLGVDDINDLYDASESTVNSVVRRLASFETKKSITRKTFLSCLEQFLSYDWINLGNITSPSKELKREVVGQPTSSENKGAEEEHEILQDALSDASDDIIERTFEKQDSSSSFSEHYPPELSKSTNKNEKRNKAVSRKGRKCKICEERVKGIDLSGDWSKRFVMLIAYQNKQVNKENCSKAFGPKIRLFVCNEHIKATVNAISMVFNATNPADFDTSYLEPETNHAVESFKLEMCSLSNMVEISTEVFIKQARSFVWSHGKDIELNRYDKCAEFQVPSGRASPFSTVSNTSHSSQLDDRKRFHVEKKSGSVTNEVSQKRNSGSPVNERSSSPDQVHGSTAPEQPEAETSTRSSKIQKRKCHVCDQSNSVQNFVVLTVSFDILCMLATLKFQHQWEDDRLMELYNNKIVLTGGPKFYMCIPHCRQSGPDLLRYLKIEDITQADDVSYDETEPLRRFFKKVDRNQHIPADFSNFIKKCMEFVTKSQSLAEDRSGSD